MLLRSVAKANVSKENTTPSRNAQPYGLHYQISIQNYIEYVSVSICALVSVSICALVIKWAQTSFEARKFFFRVFCCTLQNTKLNSKIQK